MFDRLRQDCRYAVRQMARAPMLTAVAAFVLALGIGTNASILAVIDGVVFRPPPGIHDADGLITVRNKEIKIRPLNREKLNTEKTMWQVINLGLPLAVIIVYGIARSVLRKRKFARF